MISLRLKMLRHGKMDIDYYNKFMLNHISDIQTFVLWHYQTGSKYDSPFWDYAKSLPFNPDDRFKQVLNNKLDDNYGNWEPRSFKNWKDNT